MKADHTRNVLSKMRVLFIAGREPEYMRNAMILKALKSNNAHVVACTSSAHSYARRYLEVILKFLSVKNENFDLIFVGYLGQPLVPILKLLSRKPIIFDAFLSIYDTLCFDRKNCSPGSFLGKVSYLLDKYSCMLSDIIILDTDAHIDYFIKTFGLKNKTFKKLYMGADDTVFYPFQVDKVSNKFRVFYYSTYHPLHGVEFIVRAAKMLERHEDVQFEIIGKGPEWKWIARLVKDLDIHNIKFIDTIPSEEFYSKVVYHIAESDLCLGGHFSDIDKGKRVIAEKTFEFIAMRKPVIVGDNPANRELFEDRKNALFVEHANSDALASAILELKEDEKLRERIAEGGYKTFKERCTPEVIGEEIREIMDNLGRASK